jgi:uncharacterized alpha-E superfamily protein
MKRDPALNLQFEVYRDAIRPKRVADRQNLRPNVPRSLAVCMTEVVVNLQPVANQQNAEALNPAAARRKGARHHRPKSWRRDRAPTRRRSRTS